MAMVIVSVVPLVIPVKIVENARVLTVFIRLQYVQDMEHVRQNMPVVYIQGFVANVQRMDRNHFQRGQEKHVLV